MRVLSYYPLMAISALIVFSPIQEGGTTHSSQMIIRLLILLWVGIVMAQGIRSGRFNVPMLPVGYIALTFLGLAVAATVLSPYPHPSRQWLLIISGYVVLLYLIASSIDRWDSIRTVTIMIVMVGVGEASLALLQGFAWNSIRPSGTFFNPNFLAGYLTVSWAILLSGALHGYRSNALFSTSSIPPSLWWFGVGSALGAILVAVICTQSRGGMVVLFVATVLILTVRYGWKLSGSCAVFLVVIGLLIPTPIRDRVILEHKQNPATYARWQMWQGAVTQMVDHPFGIGLGLYQYTYPLYAFPVEGEISRYGKVAQTPHNDYLQMGIEMGPGAILVFMTGVVMVVRELRKVLQGRLLRWQRALIIGVSGGGIALLVHAALDSSLRESAIAILLILCGGLIVSAGRLHRDDAAIGYIVPIRSPLVWGLSMVVGLLLIGVEVVRSALAWTTFEIASRHATAGETVAAIKGLQDAIALDPGKSLYHHGLGSIYARAFETTGEKQAFQNAAVEFKEAIDLNPLDNRLLGLLGQLYVSVAQAPQTSGVTTEERRIWLREAISIYEQAIQLAPFSAMYRYEQARLYWLLGKRKEAERRAKEAEELEPNFLPARVLLARLWFDGGKVDEARGQLREIQERQARYHPWPKNSLDHTFLNVDVAPLRATLGEGAAAG